MACFGSAHIRNLEIKLRLVALFKSRFMILLILSAAADISLLAQLVCVFQLVLVQAETSTTI